MNPDNAFVSVLDFKYSTLNKDHNWSTFIRLPRYFCIHFIHSVLKSVFRGLNVFLSRDWNLCNVFGGREIKTRPLIFAWSMNCKLFAWVLCKSKIKSTFLSIERLTNFTKCFINNSFFKKKRNVHLHLLHKELWW